MCAARDARLERGYVMSSQDPIGSAVPPERPANPTHFGGDGLYEPEAETSKSVNSAEDASLKTKSQEREQGSESSFWELARRNHVPALLAIGGVVWLLVSLVRRSTERW
jgi:hypothetical protein